MYAVFALGILLSLAGIGFSVYRIIVGGVNNTYDWIGIAVMGVVCLFLIILIIAMLISSKYTVDNEYLNWWLGFVRTRYPLKNIRSVHLFEGAKKVVVYYTNNQFSAIVISPDDFQDFIKELTSKDKPIDFTYTTAEDEKQMKTK